jgi:hypothetical protein
MNPEWIVAICAGVTLLILWTSTVIGGAIWLMNQLRLLKAEILADFNEKHKDNETAVKAMEELVMRHDLILEPEFNGSGRSYYASKTRSHS